MCTQIGPYESSTTGAPDVKSIATTSNLNLGVNISTSKNIGTCAIDCTTMEVNCCALCDALSTDHQLRQGRETSHRKIAKAAMSEGDSLPHSWRVLSVSSSPLVGAPLVGDPMILVLERQE